MNEASLRIFGVILAGGESRRMGADKALVPLAGRPLVAWVAERGVETNRLHEVSLLQRVVDWAEGSSDGWKVAGRWEPATHVGALSLIVPDPDVFHPQDLAASLDSSFDIAIRPGLHCSPYMHRTLGTFPDGTIRLSPGPFNTIADIDAFIHALTEITAGVL